MVMDSKMVERGDSLRDAMLMVERQKNTLARMNLRDAMDYIERQQALIDNLYRNVYKNGDERNEEVAINAGLRAVIRRLLRYTQAVDPNSPLLNKATRDKVFKEAEEAEMDRINKQRKANGKPLVRRRKAKDDKLKL